MTENELRARVCAQAARWIGRCEGNGSHREIIDVYNSIEPLPRGYRMTYYDPWCAAFVSAVAQTLGLCAYIYPECGCGPMVAHYQAAGRWMERDDYLPDLGDVIFYDWEDSGVGDNTGAPDHVGMVIAINGDTITVVEGNCGNAVRTRSIRRNGLNIRGYGLPDYAAAAEAEEVIIEDGGAPDINVGGKPEEPSEGEQFGSPAECSITLPKLEIGDKWGYVYAAQALLIAHGYDCGNKPLFGVEKPDGEFGRTTERSVGFFQNKHGLEVDGIIGGATWAALMQDWR